MAYLNCFPKKFDASTLATLRTIMAGLYLCRGLTREPKLLTPFMLVLLSLCSLEICAAKNPGEGEFFKSEIFQHLRRALKCDFVVVAKRRSLLVATLRNSDRCNYARDDLAPADLHLPQVDLISFLERSFLEPRSRTV